MSKALLGTVVVPIADSGDAAATARALAPHVEAGDEVTVVHVIEKAGGAPDKASVEQREEYASDLFEAFEAAYTGDATVETSIRYGTDVAATIHDSAADLDASAIVFTSRGLGGWMTFLTGNVRDELVDTADRPVVVLPDRAD